MVPRGLPGLYPLGELYCQDMRGSVAMDVIKTVNRKADGAARSKCLPRKLRG